MIACETGRAIRWLCRRAARSFLSINLSIFALALAIHPEVARAADTQASAVAARLVGEAVLAEAKGDGASRRRLLDEAAEAAPDYQLAHWQNGQVEVTNQWLPVEEAQQIAAMDPRFAQYSQLCAAANDSENSQLTLARWCRKHQLGDEAKVHWDNVLSYEPNNEEALRALGKRWYAGRLMAYAEVDATKERVRKARAAAKRFVPRVAKWERMLSAGDLASRDQALSEIRAVSDADAIPVLEDITLDQRPNTNRQLEHSKQLGLAFVEALDALPAQAATESLARHAVFSTSSSVREAASAALKRREPHDYMPMLLDGLAMPIESSFRITTDADGAVNYWHSLYRVGATADESSNSIRGAWQHILPSLTDLTADENRVPTPAELAWEQQVAQKQAVNVARSQREYAKEATAVEREVARQNHAAETLDGKIVSALANITGEDYGSDPLKWWDWWQRYNDSYVPYERPVRERNTTEISHFYFPKPEYVQERPLSCFPRGTLVWTRSGKRAIETIEIGDLVLAQSADTGELTYKPVIGRTLRPPRPMLNFSLGDEKLSATKGHPFWVAGIGWRMAKELEEGAILHGVHGPVRVTRIEPGEEFEAYNLVVADFSTYFVGDAGVLVHDNSPRQPTRATVPGVTTN
jgi:Pretoxin HINT domain